MNKKSIFSMIAMIVLIAIMSSLMFSVYAETEFDTTTISNVISTENITSVRAEIKGTVKEILGHNAMPAKPTCSMFVMKTELGKEVIVYVSENTQIISQKARRSLSFDERIFEPGVEVTVSYITEYNPKMNNANNFKRPVKEAYIPDAITADVMIRNDIKDEDGNPVEIHVYEITHSPAGIGLGTAVIPVDVDDYLEVNYEDFSETWFPYKEVFGGVVLGEGTLLAAEVKGKDENGFMEANYAMIVRYGDLAERVHVFNDAETVYCFSAVTEDHRGDGWIDIGAPVEMNDGKYLPLRKAIESLGSNFSVGWDGHSVFVCKNNVTYKFTDGSKCAGLSNGRSIYPKSNPEQSVIILNGTTYVPFNWMPEIFGILTVTPENF